MRVCCFPTEHPEEVEKAMIAQYFSDLYFNLTDDNEFKFKPLSTLRSNLKEAGSDKKKISGAFDKYKKATKKWNFNSTSH